MNVHVELPASKTPVRIVFDRKGRNSLDAYLEFCRFNPDLRIERTPEGEIVLMPPAGGESSKRSLKVAAQLDAWNDKTGLGEAFDSSAQFVLPDGSALSPDAAWVSHEALRPLSHNAKRGFPKVCPEFIVEVRSPSDRIKNDTAKMEQWISNGTQLAWLIDGDERTVYIFRRDRPVEIRKNIKTLAGEGPVKGFVLKLASIWKGLA
jgi:Uma2 family endonuclease